MSQPPVDPISPPGSGWRLKELGWAVAAWAAVLIARWLLEPHLWGMLVLWSLLVLAQVFRASVTRDPRIAAMDRASQIRHAVLTSSLVLAIVYTGLVVGRATLPHDVARLLDWFGPSLAELGAG